MSGFLPSLQWAEILAIFRLYFRRNDDFIKSFWNLLTFSGNKKRNGYSSRTLFNSNFFSIWKKTKQSVKIPLTRHFELKWNTRSMSFISNDTLSKLTTVTIFKGHSKLIRGHLFYIFKYNKYDILNDLIFECPLLHSKNLGFDPSLNTQSCNRRLLLWEYAKP